METLIKYAQTAGDFGTLLLILIGMVLGFVYRTHIKHFLKINGNGKEGLSHHLDDKVLEIEERLEILQTNHIAHIAETLKDNSSVLNEIRDYSRDSLSILRDIKNDR